MRQSGIAWVLALGLMCSLTACRSQSNQPQQEMEQTGLERQAPHPSKTRYETSKGNRSGDHWKDGTYWASRKGEVGKRPASQETEWERMGRQVKDGWDSLMKDTEKEIQRAGQRMEKSERVLPGVRDTLQGPEREQIPSTQDITGDY